MAVNVRLRLLHAAIVLAFVVPNGAAEAALVRTAKAACTLLKQRVAKLGHFQVSAIAFCDVTPAKSSPAGLYVIGLHGKRPDCSAKDMCSTLIGWYAVRKNTGEVGEFDINEWKMTPLTGQP